MLITYRAIKSIILPYIQPPLNRSLIPPGGSRTGPATTQNTESFVSAAAHRLSRRNRLGLRKGRRVADIGSGTGIFTELLLLKGCFVTGVEPNAPMRQAAEQKLGGYDRFYSLEGSAEQTGLADHSIDLITVAQAFHWMDPAPTKKEFNRILKPGGRIALIWNLRLQHTFCGLMRLVRACAQAYDAANRIDEPVLRTFFAPQPMELQVSTTRSVCWISTR